MFDTRRGTADAANSAWIGKTVYDAHRTKIGTISTYNAQAGYFVAQKGLLFSHDLYIPVGSIARTDASGVYLSLTNEQLRDERYKTPLIGGAAAAGAAATAKTVTKPDTGDGRTAQNFDRVDVTGRDAQPAKPLAVQSLTGKDAQASAVNRQDVEDITVPLREETLTANRTREQIGGVRVHRYVIQDEETIEAPVTHEEVTIEHVARPDLPVGTDVFTEKDFEVPLMGERLTLGKETRLAEEVHLHKRLVTEQQHASGTVRREQFRVEGDAQDIVSRGDPTQYRDTRSDEKALRDGETLR